MSFTKFKLSCVNLRHSIHMSIMAEKRGKNQERSDLCIRKSLHIPPPYPGQSHNTTGSPTFRLNLWNQISLDLKEYPTDSSSPLKVYLLLANQHMNVTVFLVQFGKHPSTGVMTKSDQLWFLLTLCFDVTSIDTRRSHTSFTVLGGLPSCKDDENKKFCGQSTRKVQGSPGLLSSPVSAMKGICTASLTPALPTPRPSSCPSSRELQLPWRQQRQPVPAFANCSTTSGPWTFHLFFSDS